MADSGRGRGRGRGRGTASPGEVARIDGLKNRLLDALAANNTEEALRIINANASLNLTLPNNDHNTAFQRACEKRNEQVALELVNHVAQENINFAFVGGLTRLMYSCRSGLPLVTERLISRGADINSIDAVGQTALMWCGIGRRRLPAETDLAPWEECAILLLNAGADRAVFSRVRATAFTIAQEEPRMENLIRLLQGGDSTVGLGRLGNSSTAPITTPPGENPAPATTTASAANPSAVAISIPPNAESTTAAAAATPVTSVSLPTSANNGTGHFSSSSSSSSSASSAEGSITPLRNALTTSSVALLEAINSRNIAEALRLIRSSPAPNFTSLNAATGNNPLLRACSLPATPDGDESLAPVALALIEANADVNLANASGFTPLMAASRSGFVDVMARLLEKGAELDARDAANQTALVWAALANQEQAAILLISKGADLTPTVGARRRTIQTIFPALIPVLTDSDPVVRARVRLQQINDEVAGGFTPERSRELYTLLTQDEPEPTLAAVQALLTAGANPNYVDEEGNTYLTQAMIDECPVEIVQALIDGGASVSLADRSGFTPLMCAVSHPIYISLLDSFITPDTLNAQDQRGNTAVHHACIADSTPAVIALVARGATVNMANSRGKTPLMVCSSKGNMGSARALLGAGAHLNDHDTAGKSVLEYAMGGRNPDIAHLLLLLGVDLATLSPNIGAAVAGTRRNLNAAAPNSTAPGLARRSVLTAIEYCVAHPADPRFENPSLVARFPSLVGFEPPSAAAAAAGASASVVESKGDDEPVVDLLRAALLAAIAPVPEPVIFSAHVTASACDHATLSPHDVALLATSESSLFAFEEFADGNKGHDHWGLSVYQDVTLEDHFNVANFRDEFTRRMNILGINVKTLLQCPFYGPVAGSPGQYSPCPVILQPGIVRQMLASDQRALFDATLARARGTSIRQELSAHQSQTQILDEYLINHCLALRAEMPLMGRLSVVGTAAIAGIAAVAYHHTFTIGLSPFTCGAITMLGTAPQDVAEELRAARASRDAAQVAASAATGTNRFAEANRVSQNSQTLLSRLQDRSVGSTYMCRHMTRDNLDTPAERRIASEVSNERYFCIRCGRICNSGVGGHMFEWSPEAGFVQQYHRSFVNPEPCGQRSEGIARAFVLVQAIKAARAAGVYFDYIAQEGPVAELVAATALEMNKAVRENPQYAQLYAQIDAALLQRPNHARVAGEASAFAGDPANLNAPGDHAVTVEQVYRSGNHAFSLWAETAVEDFTAPVSPALSLDGPALMASFHAALTQVLGPPAAPAPAVLDADGRGRALLALFTEMRGASISLAQITPLLTPPVNLEITDGMGMTPLIKAALYPDPAVLQALIAAGATVNRQDTRGYTALFNAAQRGFSSGVAALIAAGATVNHSARDGITALFLASTEDVTRQLLDAGADINHHADDGETALIAALGANRMQIANLLIRQGAHVADARRWASLHSQSPVNAALQNPAIVTAIGEMEAAEATAEAGAAAEPATGGSAARTPPAAAENANLNLNAAVAAHPHPGGGLAPAAVPVGPRPPAASGLFSLFFPAVRPIGGPPAAPVGGRPPPAPVGARPPPAPVGARPPVGGRPPPAPVGARPPPAPVGARPPVGGRPPPAPVGARPPAPIPPIVARAMVPNRLPGPPAAPLHGLARPVIAALLAEVGF